jgi:carbon storage regulator
MLIVTRRKNESIIIGENIVATVIEIRDGQVRLGIEAPKEMAIHRLEIYEAIKRGDVPKEENTASGE